MKEEQLHRAPSEVNTHPAVDKRELTEVSRQRALCRAGRKKVWLSLEWKSAKDY